MRICMVISVPLPPREGIGYYVWALSRFLVGQGHQVQIITRGQRGKPFYEELEGFPVWRPRFYPIYPLHVHLHRIFVQRLVRRLESEVDLLHLHTPLPPPLRTRQPYLVTAHTTAVGQARIIQVKSLRSLLVRAQTAVSLRIQRKLLGCADRIVTVARSIVEELSEYGIDPRQVEVLGNGVDTDLFRPIGGNQGAPPARTYVLAAGRLDARKGFQDLIEAMPYVVEQFPDVCLYVAGTGPMEGPLRAQVERLGLGHVVRLLGHVERSQMVALYQSATVFAHAAHYEGLPTVLLEAMACGRAVVSTAVSGALDVVEDSVNGLFVPPNAPNKMARGICRLLGDTELRAQLGAAARRTVEERFSWQIVGSNYLRCYQALLNEVD
jgi:glycosyltransferase involved in cell wall biosynthesis